MLQIKCLFLRFFDVSDETLRPETAIVAAPLMKDVADAAGVSLATVDRVLNRRKGVKARTVDRVLKAAVALGYVEPEVQEQLGRSRPPNIAFLLPAGTNPYLRLLGEKVRAATESRLRDDAQLRCFFIESFDAAALAQAIRHHAGWADGVAFMAIDHPLVREAVEEVRQAGTRVVTIVSDLSHPSRDAYVGLDNQAAGRTAGLLLGRFCKHRAGSIALVAGSRSYRAHAEREMGFLGLMEEMFPEFRVIGMREGHDDRNENYAHAMELLKQHPDLVGIYNVGGSSDGIARALREKDRAKEIVFIGHGLTADTRRLLIDGSMDVVINSDPDEVIRATLLAMAQGGGIPFVKMDVIFRENIPMGM